MKTIIFLIIIFMIQDTKAISCVVTGKKSHVLPKPSKINKNNNTTRKPNGVFFSKGRQILLTGRVMDENCVPIQGAIIQLWQQNSYGVNQDNIKASDLADDIHQLKKFDTHFVTSGEAISNNNGFYSFIISRICNDCVQGIDMAIYSKNKKLQNLETFVDLYASDFKSKTICTVGCLHPPQAEFVSLKNKQLSYKFDIVLKGKLDYRKY